MSFAGMVAVRDRLRNDAALKAWSARNFEREPTFYIGLKRASSAKVGELPIISIVRARTRISQQDETMGLAIVLGLYSLEVVDGVFQGVRLIDEMERLIIAALRPYQLACTTAEVSVEPGMAGFGDMGEKHPYYESEVQIVVNVRTALCE